MEKSRFIARTVDIHDRLRGLRMVLRPVTALMDRIAITVDTKFVKAELKAE